VVFIKQNIMKKITFLLLISLSFFAFNGCDDDDEVINYVSFENKSFDFGVELDGSSTNEFKIYATNTTGSDRSYSINVVTDMSTADPNSYTVPATVTIPANTNVGVFAVKIDDLNISKDGETLVLEFGREEGLFTGEKLVFNIKQVCPFNEIEVKITFDDYASECTWELYDSAGDLVTSAGPWADKVKSASEKVCLQDGSYTFVIYDVYGDGLTWPEVGNATITYKGNVLVFIDGDFGSEAAADFDVSM